MKRFFTRLTFLVATACIGLLPVVLALGVALFDKNYTFDWSKFFREFGLGFFCTATVAGISLEFLFSRKSATNLRIVALAYVLYPAAIVVTAVVIYGVILLGEPKEGIIVTFQAAMLLMSLVYLYSTKATKIQ